MRFLISGYYGYNNAGDEAVLAAMLQALRARLPGDTEYVVTSGNPAETAARYAAAGPIVRAIPRQDPATLARAIGGCDVFVSGGGSLLQDVTSLRNVVYYTSLMRIAGIYRKPVMVYAQGVGPLRRRAAQAMTRIVMQRAAAVTLRDEDSLRLLRQIGVRRECEVTADPVWALQPAAPPSGSVPDESTWIVNLRPWPPAPAGAAARAELSRVAAVIAASARRSGARLNWLPMQPEVDGPLCRELYDATADPGRDVLVDTAPMGPARVMAEAGRGRLMIAMRLHALIFAAAQGLRCVAIDYDPKVAAFAKLIGAPLVKAGEAGDAGIWEGAIAAARPAPRELLEELKGKALRNADIAAGMVRKGRAERQPA